MRRVLVHAFISSARRNKARRAVLRAASLGVGVFHFDASDDRFALFGLEPRQCRDVPGRSFGTDRLLER
jgi:hypothetical protein